MATILGAKWDDLGKGPTAVPVPVSQDKPLKLVAAAQAAPAEMPVPQAAPVDVPSVSVAQAEEPAVVPLPVPATESQPQWVPVGRDKPAVDTVVEPPALMAQIKPSESQTPAPAPAAGRYPVWTLLGWLMAAAAGAGTGWALAAEWGVRLSWNV